MLIHHQALLWPQRHNVNLWPMAMDHSVWIWNNMPMDDGMSPEEKWTSTKFPNYDHLRHAHVFSCVWMSLLCAQSETSRRTQDS